MVVPTLLVYCQAVGRLKVATCLSLLQAGCGVQLFLHHLTPRHHTSGDLNLFSPVRFQNKREMGEGCVRSVPLSGAPL